MAFGKKRENEPVNDNITPAAQSLAPSNKATKLAAFIKEGGHTKEELMAHIDVNGAGLASQLSYLNTKGLNIAEIAPEKAEFPMKGEDGVYFMGTLAEYSAKRASASPFGGAKKEKTVTEVMELAQKRENKASDKAAKAKDKHMDNTSDRILELRYKIADLELDLATAMLAKVEAGDYSYESCSVVSAAGSAPAIDLS